jgi:diamine N-acetyltransferase
MDADVLVIRRALISDAAAVARFGARTFADAFAADNTPDDMAVYLSHAFGESLQRAEIADPGVVTLVAESGAETVAYAQVRRTEYAGAPGSVELRRFYVDRAWHGSGIASRLMQAADEAARGLARGLLWLGVWERNTRAIAFYRKCGFEVSGSQTFVLGTDRQTDHIMTRAL